MAPILGYWNVRGLAEPIRYLMAYTGTKCEYCDYVTGDAPDYDKSCWLSVKETLGLPFPNLPYYIDGNVKLTQTLAIIRHIARKHSLCGTSEEEMMRADVVAGEAMDFIVGFIKFTYFSPDMLSFADFMMYDFLDQLRTFEPLALDPFQNIKDFMARIERIPAIKEFLESEYFRNRPISNKMAQWGTKPIPRQS
ncbi:glutathione S-transferase Mu 3-like isoform X2 [Stylophora pistillata]|uniref:glutathione S-transferase Mu 3-like isoform X2 n=1 Tax=Stylophora pistillata TaxID=50429 RepID=UPI000C04E919|nr:glutathione S-transferase Mu 3-like isoform X2 [Stylophora pistillata]